MDNPFPVKKTFFIPSACPSVVVTCGLMRCDVGAGTLTSMGGGVLTLSTICAFRGSVRVLEAAQYLWDHGVGK